MRRPFGGRATLRERRDDALDRPLGLRIAQHQRRRQADDRVAVERPVEDEAALERAAREAGRGRGLAELEPEEEAPAACGDETAPPDERAQALEQAGAEPRGARRKVFAQEHLERREARRLIERGPAGSTLFPYPTVFRNPSGATLRRRLS